MEYEAFVDMVSEEMGVDRSKIRDDTSFLGDLGIDSLTLANFVIRLERRYGIRIELSNVWDLKNVKEAYDKFQRAIALNDASATAKTYGTDKTPGRNLP